MDTFKRVIGWGILGILAFGMLPVDGALIFHITGQPRSALLTITGSGSISTSGSTLQVTTSSFIQVPDDQGEWSSVRNNVGDFLGPEWTPSARSEGSEWPLQGDLRFLGEAILDANARFSYPVTRLRMDDDLSVGGDDLDMRLEKVEPFPAFQGGFTVTATGRSTLSMGDGNTFDDLVPGIYEVNGLGDGGADAVRYVIEPAPIPEPASVLFVSLGVMWGICRRRRGG